MHRYDIAPPPFVVTGRREPRRRGSTIGFGTGHRNRCFERRDSLLGRSDARSDLALALRHQGKLDDAIIEFRDAIEIDPKDVDAPNNLGVAPRDQGKLDDAVAESRRTIEIDPKDADVHNNLGGALADQGKLDDVIIEYRRVIEIDPKNENAQRNAP